MYTHVCIKYYMSKNTTNHTNLHRYFVHDHGMYVCMHCIQEVEQLIDDTLAIYSADRIAKFDFALEDAGGSVVTNQCSKTYTPTLATVSLFGIPLWHVSTSPKAIIQVRIHRGSELAMTCICFRVGFVSQKKLIL